MSISVSICQYRSVYVNIGQLNRHFTAIILEWIAGLVLLPLLGDPALGGHNALLF